MFTTVFPKLIFQQWLKNQLPDLVFCKFYIHSACVICHCIKNDFNAFLSKNNRWRLFCEFTLLKFGFSKQTNFLYYLKPAPFFFSVSSFSYTWLQSEQKYIFPSFFVLDFFVKTSVSYSFCKSIQKLMWKRYIKGTHLRFSTSYSAIFMKIYCAFQIEKIVNQKNFLITSFCN